MGIPPHFLLSTFWDRLAPMTRAQSQPIKAPRKETRGTLSYRPKMVGEVRSRGIDTSSYANAELIDIDKPLTDQQKAFVKHWAAGESPLSASARAGYADRGKFAYRLMRYPNVLKMYNEEKAKYEASCQMTRKRVMDGLLEGVEMAKLAGEPASMIAGWREIGKMCGYYEPVTRKLDITVNGNVLLDRMNRLSDAELLRLIHDGVDTDLELLEDQR